MKRRAFVAGFAALMGALPPLSHGQPSPKMPKIGLLWPGDSDPDHQRMQWFRSGLAESGFFEGRNVTVEVRSAAGGVERLPQLATELARLNVDVVATFGIQAARAMQRNTATIPIVVMADELVGNGLVASLSRPGGNTTGVQILAPELSAKKLEILKEIVPTLSRVGAFVDPGVGLSQGALLEKAARSLGVRLQLIEVRTENDIEPAFQAAKAGRAGAVQVLASPLLFAYSRSIMRVAARHQIPTIYEWREAVEAGGLVSYGPVLSEMWRQTAAIVGKILNGARPADLPIAQPTRLELVINKKTAQALGLTIPPSLLLRADQVIE